MIRLIFYILVFYLIYKLVKYVYQIFLSPNESKKNNINYNENRTPKQNISSKDIIDADFEEIKEEKKEDKNKEKGS